MEKLIELLNEYERETFPEEHEYIEFQDGTYDDGGYWYYKEQPNMGENKGFNYSIRSDERNCEINQLLITSKKFGFIKWLVENEKLKWTNKMEMRKIMLGMPEKQDYYIMMLAVTPQPIEFLISLLK